MSNVYGLAYNYLGYKNSPGVLPFFKCRVTDEIYSETISLTHPMHTWPEVELAVEVGLNHETPFVVGVTVANDVTTMWGPQEDVHLPLSKSLKTYCKVKRGWKYLSDIDHIEEIRGRIAMAINGVKVQDSNLGRMSMFPRQALKWLHGRFGLESGDIILMGTPPHDKPRIKHGDTVHCYIEGIGEMVNHVV